MADAFIYIVDDDHPTGDLVTLCLARRGYSTRTFFDPREAIEAFTFAKPKPELLITDHEMPGMTGLELLRQCRAQVPGLKAISISGCLSEEMMEAAGIRPNALLPKPFNVQQLLSVVASFLPPQGS